MGRTMQNDTHKNSSSFQQSADKRSLLSNASGSSSLGGLGGSIGLNYAPRPSSSTRLKGLNSNVANVRNAYNQDSGVDSVALNLLPYGPSSNFHGTPQRGISEPSLLTGIGSMNHAVNSEISSLMSGLVNNSKPPFMGPSKSVTGMGLLGGSVSTATNLMNPGVSSGLAFDPSDFPPIMNSVNQSQNQSIAGSSQSRNYVSVIAKGGGNSGISPLGGGGGGGSSGAVSNQASFSASNIQASPEFSIDRDFPALPVAQSSANAVTASGAGGSGGPGAGASSPSSVIPTALPSVTIPMSSQSLNASSAETVLKNQATHRVQRSQSGSLSVGGANFSGTLQLLGDNYVTNIPKNMIDNQFGMIGLLKLIQIDPSFETLAPGLNLASLGIVNWPPSGELHSVFASPLTDQCMLRPHDMDYNVPPEYQIRSRIASRLPSDPPLENLTDEILFWIFYNCCREEVQLVAAKGLYNRDWRYHKKKMRWLTPVPGGDVIREGASEQGTYYCWEPLASEKVIQQMTICYADLDDTPTTYQLSSSTLNARVQPIPPIYHQQQQQQQQHMFSSSSGAGGSTYFTQTGRIPRPPATAANTSKLSVVSSMLPNGPTIGVSQQMPVGKAESKVNDSTVPLVVAAPGSAAAAAAAAAVSSSNGPSSVDPITTATTTVPSSSS
nr:NOT transcription regulatory protein [Echinococcus granulosus]